MFPGERNFKPYNTRPLHHYTIRTIFIFVSLYSAEATFAWSATNVAMTRKLNDVSPPTGAPRGRKRPRSHPSNASYLRHLDLTDSDEITNVGLESVALLRNLQYLDLRGCDGIADKKGIDECGIVSECISSLHQLRFLFLPRGVGDPGLVNVAALQRLEHLDLSSCSHLTNEGLARVGSLQQLKQLDLNGDRITDAALQVCLASLQQLQYLDLRRLGHLTDACLVIIGAMPQLRHLDLSGCMEITDKGLANISSLHQLQFLSLPRQITDLGLAHVALLQQLQYLDLYHLTDASLVIIGVLHELRHLDLCCCEEITDEGLVNLSSLRQLQFLMLPGHITDKGIASIGLLQQLKHLNVSRSGDYDYNKITDVGLVSIVALSQLQSLELRYCNQITDAGLVTIAALSQLQFLNLSGCDQITNIHDISSLQQLRGLALNDCNITDAGIASIGSLHQLQRLTLRCTRITDAGIVVVASLKQLQVLDVDGCTSITDATLVIVALMPQLQLLGLDCNQFDFDLFDFGRLVLVQNQQVQLWHGDWNCYNLSHVPDDFYLACR